VIGLFSQLAEEWCYDLVLSCLVVFDQDVAHKNILCGSQCFLKIFK